MYLFLTTPFPRPSTERWFGFEVGDYYYYDGGPEAYWDQKPDYIFDDKTKDEIIEQSDIADLVVSFIGLFLNFLHLLILTRKELRANVVFIIILGISICDILICIGSITERYFKDSHFIARYEGFCGTDYQWWMVFIEAFSQGIQKFGRLTEALFALSTAAIRAVTVLFPMSSMADRLMKLTSGIIILVFNSVLCGVLYSIYYSMIEIYREGNSDLSCYLLSGPAFDRNLVLSIEGYCILILTILYLLVTMVLLISLALVNKRRKNLRNEKSNNSLMLVTVMALSFLVSELIYSLIFVLDSRWALVRNMVIIQLVDVFKYISRIILTVNSIFHCLICFFLSSQYRDVVKRLVCCDKGSKEVIVEPSTHSTVKSTKASRDSGY